MRTRFDEQLEQLNVLLIDMGALCEEAINYAVGALNEGSEKMRKLTYETDKHIDDREREIENLCLKLLLQQQPVARDLRQISSLGFLMDLVISAISSAWSPIRSISEIILSAEEI